MKILVRLVLFSILTTFCCTLHAQNFDKTEIEAIVREVLKKNPEIITDAIAKKDKLISEQKTNSLKVAIENDLKDTSTAAIIGNPKGDVTIIEYIDYNCYYCHKGFADLQTILNEDKNIRVIVKDLPIIKKESLPAAKVAVVLRNDPKFFEFHSKLFQQQGIIDDKVALRVADELNIGGADLKAKAESPDTQKLIEKNYASATALGVQGTPAFVIGDMPLYGAVGATKMKMHIANFRKCGKAAGC